jgi:cell division protein FtsQ
MPERYRFFFLLLVVITATFTFINSVFFLITDVTFVGNKSLTADELLQLADIGERANYFKLDPKQVEGNLMGSPLIKEATVQKLFPSSLNIEVMERVPIAVLPKEGYFVEIDRDGVAMAFTDRLPEKSMPIVTGIDTTIITLGSRLDVPGIDNVMDIIGNLSDDFIEELSEINISDPKEIRIYTIDGLRIYLGGTNNLPKKVQILTSLLINIKERGAKVEYIDVRYENAPVVK